MLLEVCVDSVASARAAQAGGADRLELCQGLAEGGTTPSAGMIEGVRAASELPLGVLLRPRPGDFCYDADELEVALLDLAVAADLGADFAVFGALDAAGDVDRRSTARVVEAARPLPVAFHRAFDLCRDPHRALEALVELGCARVLTSGQAASALEGIELVAELVAAAAGRIAVVAGGGLREERFAEVLARSGAREFHLSAGVRVESAMRHRSERVRLGRAPEASEYAWRATDARRVAGFRALAGG